MVERIAAHHAADGIGEERGHVAAGVGAGEGDLLLGHFGLQLAVEAVGGDEEPVVLRLQLLHPADGGGALRLPIPPARLQRRALQPRPQQRLVAEVPRGLEVVPVGAGAMSLRVRCVSISPLWKSGDRQDWKPAMSPTLKLSVGLSSRQNI